VRAAYLAAERSKGRRVAALLATPALRPATTDGENTGDEEQATALLDAVTRLRTELALLDRQLAAEADVPEGRLETAAPGRGWLSDTAPPPSATETPATPVTHGRAPALSMEARAALAQRAETVWAQLRQALDTLARRDPNYASVRGFAEPQAPATVAAALPPDGALLLLYPLETELACFIVPQRHEPTDGTAPLIHAVTVPLDALSAAVGGAADPSATGKIALKALTERALKPTPSGVPAVRALEHALETLAGVLYPALAPLLPPPNPANPPALVLVPTGALHRLPLHALPWPTRDQRLLDGYTVSYATSADVLPLAIDKPAAPRRRRGPRPWPAPRAAHPRHPSIRVSGPVCAGRLRDRSAFPSARLTSEENGHG
jgi:hypothetical protein